MPRHKTAPSDPELERVGSTLRTLRELRGLTQTELADRMGIGRPHITKIELGQKPLNQRRLAQAAAALGVPQAALLILPDRDESVA